MAVALNVVVDSESIDDSALGRGRDDDHQLQVTGDRHLTIVDCDDSRFRLLTGLLNFDVRQPPAVVPGRG